MKQLGGQDTLFLSAETNGLPMHLSCFSAYHGNSIDLDHLENTLVIRLNHELSLLRYKLYQVPYNLDFPYWVEDPDFDPVYHIQRIALPEANKNNAVNQLLARLHSQPLNPERPLWQIWIIDKLGDSDAYPKNSVGLLFKIHHSLMHFGNGEKIFQALHGQADTREDLQQSRQKTLAEEGEVLHGEKPVSKMQVISRALLNNGKQSLQLLQLAGSAISHFRNNQQAATATEHPSRTIFNQRISAGRCVERIRLPLGPLAELGVDTDALAMDIVGTALKKYLHKQEHCPDFELVAGIPVLEDEQHGQRALFSRIQLGSSIENHQQRQKFIYHELANLKDNIELPRLANSFINNLYAPLIAWGVRSVVGSGLTSVLPPLCHCIISQVPVYFENYEIVPGLGMIDSCGLGPLMPNVGLFHAISCESNTIDITITACKEHLQNPGFYKHCFEEALEEITDSLVAANKPPEAEAQIQPRPRRKRKTTTSSRAKKLTS